MTSKKESLIELSQYMTELASQLGETCRERTGYGMPLSCRLADAERMFERIALAEIEARKQVEIARLASKESN